MKDDPLRRNIELELRSLRRKPASLTMETLSDAEVLTQVVGRGSIERAFTTLMALLELYGGEAEGDVRAFFETCGVGLKGETLNKRLEAYEAKHFVDRRTGLRRSDRGAAKLSYILRDDLPNERPWGNIAVGESQGLVRARVWVDVFHGAMWQSPRVYINGEFQDRQFELHDSTNSLFATAEEAFDDVVLLGESDDLELFTITVYWSMPVWPIWKVGADLTSSGIYAVLTTERHRGAEVTIVAR